MKVCCTCKEEKSVEQFGVCRTAPDGFQKQCRPCKRETHARWSKRNAEKLSAYNAKRYEENKESIRKATKDYRDRKKAESPDEVRASAASRMRRWRENEANQEKSREKNRLWFKENPDKSCAKSNKRNAAKLQRTIKLSPEHELAIKRLYAFAKYISEKTKIPHHVDHIVPLQGKEMTGLHVPWNLQVIAASSNLAKGNKIDYEKSLPACLERSFYA